MPYTTITLAMSATTSTTLCFGQLGILEQGSLTLQLKPFNFVKSRFLRRHAYKLKLKLHHAIPNKIKKYYKNLDSIELKTVHGLIDILNIIYFFSGPMCVISKFLTSYNYHKPRTKVFPNWISKLILSFRQILLPLDAYLSTYLEHRYHL